jgi:hypothetical protein
MGRSEGEEMGGIEREEELSEWTRSGGGGRKMRKTRGYVLEEIAPPTSKSWIRYWLALVWYFCLYGL